MTVFGDLLELPLRSGINAPSRVRGSGVKLVNMGELFAHDRIGDVPMERAPLPSDDPDRYLLKAGDLLFARQSLKLEGAGRCCLVMPAREPRTWEGHIIRARLNGAVADGAFYYYWFRSPPGRAAVRSIVEQVAAAGIRGSDLARLSVPVPSLPEQRAIADILRSLDDKITSNSRMIDLLDELFLAECEAALAHAAPRQTDQLGNIAHVWLGGTPSRRHEKFWAGGEIEWINSGCLHQRPVVVPADKITDLGLGSSAAKIAPSGSTLLAITGATLGVVSRLERSMAFNQSVIAVHASDTRLTGYLYYWLRTNIDQLVQSATGAAQQHVNRNNVCELSVPVPDDRLLEVVGNGLPLLDQVDSLARQRLILSELRDALLPELLDGRLTVPIPEDLLGAAT